MNPRETDWIIWHFDRCWKITWLFYPCGSKSLRTCFCQENLRSDAISRWFLGSSTVYAEVEEEWSWLRLKKITLKRALILKGFCSDGSKLIKDIRVNIVYPKYVLVLHWFSFASQPFFSERWTKLFSTKVHVGTRLFRLMPKPKIEMTRMWCCLLGTGLSEIPQKRSSSDESQPLNGTEFEESKYDMNCVAMRDWNCKTRLNWKIGGWRIIIVDCSIDGLHLDLSCLDIFWPNLISNEYLKLFSHSKRLLNTISLWVRNFANGSKSNLDSFHLIL